MNLLAARKGRSLGGMIAEMDMTEKQIEHLVSAEGFFDKYEKDEFADNVAFLSKYKK